MKEPEPDEVDDEQVVEEMQVDEGFHEIASEDPTVAIPQSTDIAAVSAQLTLESTAVPPSEPSMVPVEYDSSDSTILPSDSEDVGPDNTQSEAPADNTTSVSNPVYKKKHFIHSSFAYQSTYFNL